jgi:hypothetical protein
MKPPKTTHAPSRRDFFSRASGTTAALSVCSLLPSAAAGQANTESRPGDAIVIRVPAPAGPPPLGAPVETSIPFPPGRLRSTVGLAVHALGGRPVLAQFRSGLNWPDGTIRWLAVVFEAAAGPGDYELRTGETPAADLVRENAGTFVVATGAMTAEISTSGSGWLRSLSAPDANGAPAVITTPSPAADVVIVRHDGKQFRASLDGGTRRITVEERGPVRACVRVEGTCRADDGENLFGYLIRCRAYRDRPDLHLEFTWINTTGNQSEQIRDIRMVFPFDFEPDRLVIGCESGVYDGPFLKDWPVFVLQEDYNSYWAKTVNPDGRVQSLSSGGCNGERAPGWLYVHNPQRSFSVWVPQFWESYPNEIAVQPRELSIGLWPQRAVKHLLSKPILDPNAQGTPYFMSKYSPILPHPYWAFLNPRNECLDALQGMAKTQEVVLSAWAGHGEAPTFEARWWRKSLAPVRGHPDPEYVTRTGALGEIAPRDANRLPDLEGLFDESYGWLNRHIDFMKCYGKFDYGDFKYFTAATDYLCTPGTKWGTLGEMPREGYWQNNEGDQLLGLILYYFRTGDAVAWERCRIVARHLLDIDMRHHPYWGLYTHGYGHCYVATASAGEPDHSWLLGLLAWAGISGDPTAWEWLLQCGDYLAGLNPSVANRDARSCSVLLHMMCQFYRYTGKQKFLAAAEMPAGILLKYQHANGSWPAYLGNLSKREITGFADHALMALADYYSLTSSANCLEPLKQAWRYAFGPEGVAESMDVSALTIYGAALLSAKTGDRTYAESSVKALRKVRASQDLSADPYGQGDTWAAWGQNNPTGAKGTGRPPQFLSQTRPVSVGFILAYGQPALAMAEKAGAKPSSSKKTTRDEL